MSEEKNKINIVGVESNICYPLEQCGAIKYSFKRKQWEIIYLGSIIQGISYCPFCGKSLDGIKPYNIPKSIFE